MHNFNVGDKVRIKEFASEGDLFHNPSILRGMRGVIVELYNDVNIGVEFTRRLDPGHDCGGYGRNGYCYYVKPNALELIYDNISIKIDDLL